jgi:thymidylate kinase
MSMLFILTVALDFNIGYILSTYPAMTRSETVIFDRYFHDLLIDPKRYRYAGPRWLAQLLSRFIPPRKALFIILDAEEEVILSRKQELPLHELKRQRAAYRAFGSRMSDAMIIRADRPIDEIVSEIVHRLDEVLAARNVSPSGERENLLT